MSLTFCATVKMRTCETILFIQNMYLVNTVLSYFLKFLSYALCLVVVGI